MGDAFLYENIAFLMIYIMLVLIIFFGIRFIIQGKRADNNTAQRDFFIGLGLFIISVAIGEGIYLSDLVYRAYTGSRIFLPLGDNTSGPSWQTTIGYELASLIDRDYYIVIFVILLISLSFLMMPLEKFMLRRDKPIITYLNRIFIPSPVIIRFLEVNFYNIFGIKVIQNSIPYFIFSLLWIIIILIIAISIIILLGLYLKMGIKAPKGSSLKKKSLLIIAGIFLWMITIFITSTIFREISSGNWIYIPIIPLFLLVSFILLTSGFKREY
ncbi:MAG: hypothetical protein ACTSR8_19820 [Promethearchaeota archaeon]